MLLRVNTIRQRLLLLLLLLICLPRSCEKLPLLLTFMPESGQEPLRLRLWLRPPLPPDSSAT